MRQFEQLLCSETYWTYLPQTETFPCFQAIHRPIPHSVAGSLLRYEYDPMEGVFSCAWQEYPTISDPSLIYLPDWFGFDRGKLVLKPQGGVEVQTLDTGWLLKIRPLNQATIRQLLVIQA